MQNIIIFSVLFIVAVHYTKELVLWLLSVYKPETDRAEFTADLYRLQQKWGKRGQYDFSESLGLVIKSMNLPSNEEKGALSQNGKEILNFLKEEAKKEILGES